MLRVNTRAQVLVDDVSSPVLDADDLHHLKTVLRLRDGERVSVIDGEGRWTVAAWVGRDRLSVDDEVRTAERPTDTAVAFALSKYDKPELVVQKLTEIGVARIIPFKAHRSIVKWDDEKAHRNHERLEKIAREAAMQSRRVFLPVVEPVTDAKAVAAEGFAAAQWGGTARANKIAVGPEGGWSPEELALFAGTVDLGATVLRAETAAIVAGAVVVQG